MLVIYEDFRILGNRMRSDVGVGRVKESGRV